MFKTINAKNLNSIPNYNYLVTLQLPILKSMCRRSRCWAGVPRSRWSCVCGRHRWFFGCNFLVFTSIFLARTAYVSARASAECAALEFQLKFELVGTHPRACFSFLGISWSGVTGKNFCFHWVIRSTNTQLLAVKKYGGTDRFWALRA